MYIYTYIYIYTRTHTYAHTSTHTHTHTLSPLSSLILCKDAPAPASARLRAARELARMQCGLRAMFCLLSRGQYAEWLATMRPAARCESRWSEWRSHSQSWLAFVNCTESVFCLRRKTVRMEEWLAFVTCTRDSLRGSLPSEEWLALTLDGRLTQCNDWLDATTASRNRTWIRCNTNAMQERLNARRKDWLSHSPSMQAAIVFSHSHSMQNWRSWRLATGEVKRADNIC